MTFSAHGIYKLMSKDFHGVKEDIEMKKGFFWAIGHGYDIFDTLLFEIKVGRSNLAPVGPKINFTPFIYS